MVVQYLEHTAESAPTQQLQWRESSFERTVKIILGTEHPLKIYIN